MFVRTDRLFLRPGWIEDAPALAHAIGSEAIARNTARIPWPYTLADAEAWLGTSKQPHAPECLVFARTSGVPRLIGGVGLSAGECGQELGYWIAQPFWGLGFATEAAEAFLRGARHTLRVGPIHATHFTDNPASGRALRKLGFRPTGRVVRRHSAARAAPADCLLFSDGDDAHMCLKAA